MNRPLLALFLAAVCSAALAQTDPKRFEHDVTILAADDMEGRGLGTKGIEKAAGFIEQHLRDLRLQPAFGASYRQPFPVKIGVSLAAGNRLAGIADSDWTPLGFSSSGAFNAPIAFVGYGIAADPLHYNDFDGVDLKGKVALMLRYEPQEKDDKSIFDGRKPSRWSALRYKVLQARERGAVAVVFVNGPLQNDDKDRLPVLKNDGPESPAGLPVIQVRLATAQKWLGFDLGKWQKEVDADLKPRSRVLDAKLEGRVAVEPTFVETSNLAAILPGSGTLANEIVVLGAHYDHLGYGGEGSLRPNEHAIHHGADDNASGTTAVLLAAEKLRDLPAPHRTILFCLFSGEESGLAGSSWLVAHPPVPLKSMVAMVNLDMVGMLREDKLIAFGADSAPEWRALIDRSAAPLHLAMTEKGDGYGPSDQTSFYAQQIPVLHFFTGAHERYHTPDDQAQFLNYPGAARVTDLTAAVVSGLARGDVTPKYARVAVAPAMEGDSRGYGAYLGTVPDYSAMDADKGGVLLADVRPGGPAEKAGIRGKDRIVSMAGTRIENLYDMTYALQDHKPGDTIEVVVVREEKPVKLRATLGSRSEGVPAFTIGAGKPFEKTFDGEKHLADVRQLTFGGENAEAYWSPDGKKLIFQAHEGAAACDQEYVMDLATGETKRVSDGKGRTTCGYFSYPKGDRIIYASTEAESVDCPPPADRSHGYVWAVYPSYDIFEAKPDGSDAHRITTTPGYDAEATWCHKGGKFVFTSMRDGDLDLYERDDAGNVKRLTNTPGYDGGAFYNADCTEITFRAFHPTGAALDEYRALLMKNLVKPSVMEIFVMNADGSSQRQLTHSGAANFCPYFAPDQHHIIYSSNAGDPKGREFDLWMVDERGGEPERITTAPGFDAFPMFSPDGKWLVWGSNRAKPDGHETNLFVARWVN